MRKYIKTALVVVGLALCGPALVRAQNQTLVDRARTFLENGPRARAILFFAHPEAKYQGVRFLQQYRVTDGSGNAVPGYFALGYRYSWKSGLSGDINTTDLAFFFDRNGRFYGVKAVATTSFLRPFGVADAVVKALRDDIIAQVDKKGTEADKKLVRELLANGDARGLLTLLLKLAQP